MMNKETEIECVNVFKSDDKADRERLFNELIALIINHQINHCANDQNAHFKS